MSTIFQALDIKAGLIHEPVPPPQRAPDVESRIRVLPMQLTGSSPLLPYDGGSPCAGEQYRAVRTNLLQNPDAPRVLVVSSCGAGDGKTVSAVNTAGALAIKGDTTVLLVDADLRHPSRPWDCHRLRAWPMCSTATATWRTPSCAPRNSPISTCWPPARPGAIRLSCWTRRAGISSVLR